jgi:hypothetical protein
MGTCHQCGLPVGPGARFCTGCGTAVSASVPRSPAGVIAALGASVTVLAGVAAFVVFAKPGVVAGIPTADPDFRPVVAVPVPDGADESVPTPEDTPTVEPVEPVDPLDAALAELQLIRDADRAMVESLVGQWVPQLSAKRPGMVVHGVTYDYVEILRDYRATQARYPDALLLYSGEYSSFRYDDFWITIEPLPHDDGPSANGWCDGQGIPVDDCYAKMISHTVGYEGATLLRGQ